MEKCADGSTYAQFLQFYSHGKGHEVYYNWLRFLKEKGVSYIYGSLNIELPNVERKLLIYLRHGAKIYKVDEACIYFKKNLED